MRRLFCSGTNQFREQRGFYLPGDGGERVIRLLRGLLPECCMKDTSSAATNASQRGAAQRRLSLHARHCPGRAREGCPFHLGRSQLGQACDLTDKGSPGIPRLPGLPPVESAWRRVLVCQGRGLSRTSDEGISPGRACGKSCSHSRRCFPPHALISHFIGNRSGRYNILKMSKKLEHER